MQYKFNHRSLELTLNSEADQSVFEEIFKDRDYRIIDPIIEKATAPILDIGAHIGLFSLYAATLNPHVPILSFEPDPENFRALKEHLKENRIKNVSAKNVAISDINGGVTLHRSADSHNHSLFTGGEELNVQSNSFEKITDRYEHFALAKIDCEGAEFPILLNSPDQALLKVSAYYIEYHQFQPDFKPSRLLQRLQFLGYKTQSQPSKYDQRMGFVLANSCSLR